MNGVSRFDGMCARPLRVTVTKRCCVSHREAFIEEKSHNASTCLWCGSGSASHWGYSEAAEDLSGASPDRCHETPPPAPPRPTARCFFPSAPCECDALRWAAGHRMCRAPRYHTFSTAPGDVGWRPELEGASFTPIGGDRASTD